MNEHRWPHSTPDLDRLDRFVLDRLIREVHDDPYEIAAVWLDESTRVEDEQDRLHYAALADRLLLWVQSVEVRLEQERKDPDVFVSIFSEAQRAGFQRAREALGIPALTDAEQGLYLQS